MEKRPFGPMVNGDIALLYTITNGKGMQARLTDYGAAVVSLVVPDRQGRDTDVVLGYDDVADYETQTCFFGAAIGRCGNRIAGAAFTIDGVSYEIEANEKGNSLHSGSNGTHARIWEVKEQSKDSITFTIEDPSEAEGFPGDAVMEVTYTVTSDNALDIRYHAVCDRKTVFNLTNHSYFNLNGHASGSVYTHMLQLNASGYTPIDSQSIPTGEIAPVAGTPFDFRTEKPIGQDIAAEDDQIRKGQGYDHNFALDRQAEGLSSAAKVYAPESGISMEVLTDLPGVQFYSANFIEGQPGKGGVTYHKRGALCLETQYFPNSVNEPNFERPVTEANVSYETETVYRFGIR